MNAQLRAVSLDDRYAAEDGAVVLSGTQALVRLLLQQRALDRARGWNTAGYVSGYRGSPLGGLDQQLWRAQRFLDAAGIVFEPGLNEDLAATAIWGTQQVPLLPGARCEGVFSLWYGKGPGIDRSGDPIKHGNRMGTSPRGGVLLAFGDDHGGKSSTIAHQSEQALAANGVPVLYPASVQEYLDLGVAGFALSRYAGVWVGFKCVNETVESTATVEVGAERVQLLEPQDTVMPAGGLHARIAFDPVGDDVRLQRYKLPAAQAFARANAFDRIVMDRGPRRLGIVAAGKSYRDTRAALRLLGIDEERAASLGILLYKPALIWPLEPQRLRRFARGCAELLVIEEKAAFLEPQIAHALYHLPAAERPCLAGKFDASGAMLLPADVVLECGEIAGVIAARLAALGVRDAQLEERAAALARLRQEEAARAASPLARTPYFCSGCPHNTSTRVPEGSLALAGIGCHSMAMSMERRTLPPTQMGGEGMSWAGIAPFTDMPHVFQNLGDGTYTHSGLLAVRGAVAAGVNVTYKLLINDAVAMTGGQPVEGAPSVPEISRQLAAERVRRIAVVSDDPKRWRRVAGEFAAGVTIHSRDELDRLQREFREVPGVSAILYEQTCAAEKRRRRKRGTAADPERRVFIHPDVCEGCGDCSTKSNCVSVEPLETELGRKRRIDQSSCNKDYSCIKGFCPSFVLIEGARLRRPARGAGAPALQGLDAGMLEALPEPPTAASSCNALIAGIGGTGVVTIGAVLAMAAHLERRHASVYDLTGLAQKGGAVTSHLRIAADAAAESTALIEAGGADLVLACDPVVAAGRDALRTIDPARTQLIVNTHLAPVARFQRDRDIDFHGVELFERARSRVPAQRYATLEATRVAEALLGDTIASNMIMTGYAYQHGALPLSAAAIERAIELNGAAVELNRTAFRLGRLLRHDPARVLRLLPPAPGPAPGNVTDLEQLIRARATLLEAYQDARYAQRYRSLVERVRAAERSACGSEELTLAVARSFAKLLAYKDEYEVARLLSERGFRENLARQFEGRPRLRVLLAPPLIARRDRASGEPRKHAFGPWVFPLMRLLAAARRLRGTRLDPFGYSAERRAERALIADYERMLGELLPRLAPHNLALAVELASIPEAIRGFGHVKSASIAAGRARGEALRAQFEELAAPAERVA